MSSTNYCWLVLRDEAQMIQLSRAVAHSTERGGPDYQPRHVRIYIKSAVPELSLNTQSRTGAESGGAGQAVQIKSLHHELVSCGNLHATTSEETWSTISEAEAWARRAENEFFFAHRTDAFIIAVATGQR